MNMQKVFKHHEPKIEFEEIPSFTDATGIRHYNTPTGRYPSVTTVTGWEKKEFFKEWSCLLYTSPSPRDGLLSRMPSSA